MKQLSIFFLLLFPFLFSCGSEKDSEANQQQKAISDSSSVIQPESEQTDLSVVGNNEIVAYCVLVPLNEYEENFEEQEKAVHRFVHRTKPKNEISIQGLLRVNTEVSIEDYFAGSLEDAELEGKIIEKKELLKGSNCFYSKGYWANTIYEFRFIEVCWLRSDDVVKYYSSFDIADTTLWNVRLEEILKSRSECK